MLVVRPYHVCGTPCSYVRNKSWPVAVDSVLALLRADPRATKDPDPCKRLRKVLLPFGAFRRAAFAAAAAAKGGGQ